MVKKRTEAANGKESLNNDDLQVLRASTDDKDLGPNTRYWTEEETEYLIYIYMRPFCLTLIPQTSQKDIFGKRQDYFSYYTTTFCLGSSFFHL
jgi:hypothetical protein